MRTLRPQADHAGRLEEAVSGYAEALRHLYAYLRMETDEAKKDAVRSKAWGRCELCVITLG